ncbi:MAG: ribosome assembly RNA-binding protein YhbY [Deltaproteobacteria bacterium]|nr:ribosome assembly RNA-binding protein YhbY [Deltaproteobacteria bacterium]
MTTPEEVVPATLSGREVRYLRGLGQALDPVVSIGANGLSDAVVAQIDGALDHHELIKVRVGRAAHEDKDDIDGEIASRVGCLRVQRIGHVLLLFRKQGDLEKRRVWLPGEKRPESAAKKPTRRAQSSEKKVRPRSRG